MSDDACAICAILDAAQGQQFAVALALLRVTYEKVRCQCPGVTHTPLAQHPHMQTGCEGYRQRFVGFASLRRARPSV